MRMVRLRSRDQYIKVKLPTSQEINPSNPQSYHLPVACRLIPLANSILLYVARSCRNAFRLISGTETPVAFAMLQTRDVRVEANELGELEHDIIKGDYAVLGRRQTKHVQGVAGNIINNGTI